MVQSSPIHAFKRAILSHALIIVICLISQWNSGLWLVRNGQQLFNNWIKTVLKLLRHSLKTINWKQHAHRHCLSLDANCDIMFKILHKIKPFGPISWPETCDVRLIFLLTFFFVHVIITTIINIRMCWYNSLVAKCIK